jgi:hypothetical protein
MINKAQINKDRIRWITSICNQALNGEISATEAERRIRLVQTDYNVDQSLLPGVLFEDCDLAFIEQIMLDKQAEITDKITNEQRAAQSEGRRFLIERIALEGQLNRIADALEKIQNRRQHLCPECGVCAPWSCKMDCSTKKFKREVHIGWGPDTLCKHDASDFPQEDIRPLANKSQHDEATCADCKVRLVDLLKTAEEMGYPLPWK